MRRGLGATLCAAAALALACAFGGSAPRDHFYRLQAPEPQQVLPAPLLQGTLRVDPPRAGGLLRGTSILYHEAGDPGELMRYSFHRWTDSAPLMIQTELIRFVRAAGLAENVISPDLGIRPVYVLGGRILQLEQERRGDGDGRVIVELELDLTESQGRTLMLQRSYREERPSPADAREAAARMNEAFGAVLQRFLADVVAALGARKA